MMLMHGADVQKYVALSHKRQLVTDGFFKCCRNPNYLGEMFIYGAFNLIARSYYGWVVCVLIWASVFYPNM